MYIFIKIFDNKPVKGINNKPFILEHDSLEYAIYHILEKYRDKETAEKVIQVLL